jgi:hypothetical protein
MKFDKLFYNILTIVVAASIIYTCGIVNPPRKDMTTPEAQEEVRQWCKRNNICDADIIYDYPDNPYVYWKGKRVYLRR